MVPVTIAIFCTNRTETSSLGSVFCYAEHHTPTFGYQIVFRIVFDLDNASNKNREKV